MTLSMQIRQVRDVLLRHHASHAGLDDSGKLRNDLDKLWVFVETIKPEILTGWRRDWFLRMVGNLEKTLENHDEVLEEGETTMDFARTIASFTPSFEETMRFLVRNRNLRIESGDIINSKDRPLLSPRKPPQPLYPHPAVPTNPDADSISLDSEHQTLLPGFNWNYKTVEVMVCFLTQNPYQYVECLVVLCKHIHTGANPTLEDVKGKWRRIVSEHNAGVRLHQGIMDLLSPYLQAPGRQDWETEDVFHKILAEFVNDKYPISWSNLVRYAKSKGIGEKVLNVVMKKECFITGIVPTRTAQNRSVHVHVPHG
ncbi:hypothetical protein CC78DRAFT_586297 [Lojkania enalia]|uniref:Uncharacterized protein n=1 Tax=Lojkania enalia TaxID=147567 RepID=A0A9P4N1W6_9PLEO|nr:hypothetical protein CC78DRAFT_586297 [Didymosphaeria enalia]